MEQNDRGVESWMEHRLMVLKTLKDIETKGEHLEQLFNDLNIAVTIIKTKSAILGAVLGALMGGAISLLVIWLSK